MGRTFAATTKPSRLLYNIRVGVYVSDLGDVRWFAGCGPGKHQHSRTTQKRKAVANAVHVVGVGVTKLEKLGT